MTSELQRAVEVMDRLRGCPWEAEQTHESLRQYLIEETYELLDAIETADRIALREELGDVLLQVLFHARVAADDPGDPFTIEDVAAELVTKIVGRLPHVFAENPSAADSAVVFTAEEQQARWDQLKQLEKQRSSSIDGVALGQPAAALAGKLVSRTAKAGLPPELLDGFGELFSRVAVAKLAEKDPEGELRAQAKAFASAVRAAEDAARADGVTLTPETWRAYWPR